MQPKAKITADEDLATPEARSFRIQQLKRDLAAGRCSNTIKMLRRIKALRAANGEDVSPKDHGALLASQSQAEAGFHLAFQAKAPVYHPC